MYIYIFITGLFIFSLVSKINVLWSWRYLAPSRAGRAYQMIWMAIRYVYYIFFENKWETRTLYKNLFSLPAPGGVCAPYTHVIIIIIAIGSRAYIYIYAHIAYAHTHTLHTNNNNNNNNTHTVTTEEPQKEALKVAHTLRSGEKCATYIHTYTHYTQTHTHIGENTPPRACARFPPHRAEVYTQ